MNIYSTITDIEQAILQVGDAVRILGERTEGDMVTMTGRVRSTDHVITNRVVYSKNGLPIEIFPTPATDATKEFVEGEIHDFHTDTVKDVWQPSQQITSWVHKIFQDGEYRIPKTIPFVTKATWDSDKNNWVILDSEQSTLRKVFGSEPVTLSNGLVITPTDNQYPRLSAFGVIYELADNSVAYTVKSFVRSVGGDCVITLSDDTPLIAKKVDSASKNWVQQEAKINAVGQSIARSFTDYFSEKINVKNYGAGLGGSDVDAFNTAILTAFNMNIKTICIPNGVYDLRAGGVNPIIREGTKLVGDNARILCRYGTVFKFGSDTLTKEFHFDGAQFIYDLKPDGTLYDVDALPIHFSRILYGSVRNVKVEKAPKVLKLERCSNISIDYIKGETFNIGRVAIELIRPIVTTLDNISLITTATLQNLDPDALPQSNLPVPNNIFIHVHGGCDTVVFGQSVLSNRFWRGLVIDNVVGEATLNIYSDSLVVDYCYDRGIVINGEGSVSNIEFLRPYIQAANGVGIELNVTGGQTQNISVIRPKILFSGTHGIYAHATADYILTRLIIENPYVIGSGRIGQGYDLFMDNVDYEIRGGHIGRNGKNELGIEKDIQGKYGLYSANCERYLITDLSAGGKDGSYIFVGRGAASQAKVLRDNKVEDGHSNGRTRPDYINKTFTQVSTTTTIANTYGAKESISIVPASGSVTAAIKIDGTIVATNGTWSGTLDSGSSLIIENPSATVNVARVTLA